MNVVTNIDNLKLDQGFPADQIHILAWEDPDEHLLYRIRANHHAQVISYRENLIQRQNIINPDSDYLLLHQHEAREIQALRDLCNESTYPIVVLTEFDIYLTYLLAHPKGLITQFWSSIGNIRKLKRRLWLVLPKSLVSHQWPSQKLITLNLTPPHSHHAA